MLERFTHIVQSRWFNTVLFAAVLVYFGSELRYGEMLTQRPSSIHQWRQADGASLALNFYQDGNSMFEPAIHNQLGSEGQAGGEFPITYWAASKLYHLFGPEEWMLRALHLAIFLIGLFALLYALLPFFPIRLFALFPLIWFVNSPTLVFYANNFLPDGPGLGFSLLGTAFFLGYLHTGNLRLFYTGAVAFMLCALIKVSMLVPFFAFGALGLWALLFPRFAQHLPHLAQLRWKHWIIAAAIVLIPAATWYPYISWYNAIHDGTYFRTKVQPLWSLNDAFFQNIVHALKNNWIPLIYPVYAYIAIGISTVLAAVQFIRKRSLAVWFLLLVALGCTAYMVLFFDAFMSHDYYLLTVMFFPLFVLIYAMRQGSIWLSQQGKSWSISLAVLVLFVFTWRSADECRRKFKNMYMGHFMHELSVNPSLYDLEPFLEAHGIGPDTKVICLPDNSPNRSLYLMNRKGWSGLTGIYSTDDVERLMERGAEYAVVIDTSFRSIHFLQYNMGDTVGLHKDILVFKLKPSRWYQPQGE